MVYFTACVTGVHLVGITGLGNWAMAGLNAGDVESGTGFLRSGMSSDLRNEPSDSWWNTLFLGYRFTGCDFAVRPLLRPSNGTSDSFGLCWPFTSNAAIPWEDRLNATRRCSEGNTAENGGGVRPERLSCWGSFNETDWCGSSPFMVGGLNVSCRSFVGPPGRAACITPMTGTPMAPWRSGVAMSSYARRKANRRGETI